MSLAVALADLYARVPRGMRLGLDAMNEACANAGHPERAFEAVHVAGTNGKGSVCAMVESIAREAGKKTGLYTSPHLCRFAERIRIDGEPITDVALEGVLTRALALGPELSFFETATLAAFLAFQDAQVDLAVIEVGIGGRLDATNVIPPPRVGAITRIAFDHMDKLGDTLVAIAREKAAIAKPCVTIVLGAMEQGVHAAIDDVARSKGARTVTIDQLGSFDAFFGMSPPLAGAHQVGNADVALGVGRLLGVDDETMARGLAKTRWPGRLEKIQKPEGVYLLDGAHNPDGAAALAAYLDARGTPSNFGSMPPPSGAPTAIVFGALADKAWADMLDLLAPLTPNRVYVEPHGRAATPPAELAKRHPGALASTIPEALSLARALAPGGLVVVCGSLYLVGEARAELLGLPRDPPVAM